jgi:hypothetical protein
VYGSIFGFPEAYEGKKLIARFLRLSLASKINEAVPSLAL